MATSDPVCLSIPLFTSPKEPDPIFSLTSNLSAKLYPAVTDGGAVEGVVFAVGDCCCGLFGVETFAKDATRVTAAVFGSGGDWTFACDGTLVGDNTLGLGLVGVVKCGICGPVNGVVCGEVDPVVLDLLPLRLIFSRDIPIPVRFGLRATRRPSRGRSLSCSPLPA